MSRSKIPSNALKPGRIGSMEVRNRLVRMGAQIMPVQSDTDENKFSDKLIDYYEALAAGGMGFVSVAGSLVRVDGNPDAPGFNPDTDECIPGLKKVVDAIHKHGAKAVAQMLTPYPALPVGAMAGNYLSLGASTLTQEDLNGLVPFFEPPTEMTHEQIEKLTANYVAMARRLQRAGFDAVELNGAHVHFFNTFLSPAWNRRTDEYGVDAHGRTKVMRDILRAIKAELGSDFPVITLINGCEYNLPGGITLADGIEHAKELEAAGSDAIHVRVEIYHDEVPGITVRTVHEIPDVDLYPALIDENLTEYGIDTSFGKGVAAWSEAASRIKQHVSIPVICSGRMDAFSADKLIANGKIDFANICRRSIADHDYVNKIAAGELDEVRPCVGCFTCYDAAERGVTAQCMVNSSLLMGRDYATVQPAQTPKRVVVVGSGAAGLESARVAALRGHDVTIVEKESSLGGSLPLAAMIKDFHEDFQGFSAWQVRQVEKLGVKKMLKTTATPDLIRELNPDTVIVAVGGAENIPNIPGMDNKIVVTGEQLHDQLRTYTSVFSTRALGRLSKIYLPLGKRVIIMGGAIHGVQTARFLVARGRKVTIVEESGEFGTGMLDCGPKPRLLTWLKNQGVEFVGNVKYRKVVDNGLIVEEEDGTERLIEADNIVTALPMLPNMRLYNELKDIVPEAYAVGDCNPLQYEEEYPPMMLQPTETKPLWPSFTVTAMREAFRIAREI